MNNQPASQDSAKPPRRRRVLFGCLIAVLIAVLLLLAAWWLVNRYLGDMLTGLVRDKADESIEGRLEFATLEVDLAGRAVMTDAKVYPAGGDAPWITCPRVLVGFDLLTFFGPNRGRRAVSVTLYEPWVRLEREPDGRFNLARLVKPRESTGEQLGVSVNLRDLQVDFTDWCLLDQSYPEIKAGEGLATRLLDELGYRPAGAQESRVHEETLVLTGTVVVNPEREELAVNARLERADEGGLLKVRGTTNLTGSAYEAHLDIDQLGLASLSSYLNQIFPRLGLVADSGESPPVAPNLSATINAASLQLTKRPEVSPVIKGSADLSGLVFSSNNLPRMRCNKLVVDYDTGAASYAANLDTQTLGCRIQGRPRFRAKDGQLSGELQLSCADPAALAAQLGQADMPLSGAVEAKLNLGGTTAAPDITLTLSSKQAQYDEVNLGRLNGVIAYAVDELKIEKLEFAGGDVSFKVTGGINLAKRQGQLEATTGALPARQARDLAARFGGGDGLGKLELTGSLSAAATITLDGDSQATSIRTWSDALSINGQQLKSLDVIALIQPPNIKIKEAEALYIAPQAVDLAGFTSDGPLKADLRLGGSVSLLPDQTPVLALVGTGETLNLAPEQARLSFKAVGPANDPELRLQVKSQHSENPLVFNAQGHYREGFAPVTAQLTWQETTAEFTGKVDFAKEKIQGTLAATDVDLGRFSGDPRVRGQASLNAEVGGTFSAPDVTGSVTADQLVFDGARRAYAVHEAQADLIYQGGQSVSITDGHFIFDGNHFTAGGTLGQAGSNLEFSSLDFNLFSVLAAIQPVDDQSGAKSTHIRPPLEIKSSGPLKVRLTGDLADPQAEISYTSGSGQVEGHAFSSARLNATADLKQAKVGLFEVTSTEGRISLTGNAAYEPLAYTADIDVQEFDIAVLTPLAGNELLAGLTGLLNGAVEISGNSGGYSASGQLSLKNGRFHGTDISQAQATLSTSGGVTKITAASVQAQGTNLTANGQLGPAPGQYQLSAKASSLDLGLLTPFLPPEIPALNGRLALDLELGSGRGKYPELTVDARNVGGAVGAGSIRFDALEAEASIKSDKLRLQRCQLTSGQNSLHLTAQLDLAVFEAGGTQRGLPLDVTVGSQDFDLDNVAQLLPEAQRQYVPGGVITCRNVHLTGTSSNPELSGNVTFDLNRLPQVSPYLALIENASGEIDFVPGDFTINRLRLTPAGGSGAQGAAIITGGGGIRLSPFQLKNGSVTIDLGGQEYIYIDTAATDPARLGAGDELPVNFAGWVGGTIQVSAPDRPAAGHRLEISGSVGISNPGKGSSVSMAKPKERTGESQPAPFRFSPRDGLRIAFNDGTEFLYDRGSNPTNLDLKTNVVGAITLRGVPGIWDRSNPDALRVEGSLELPKGSMRLYRHIVRLQTGGNRLTFTNEPGDMYPYLTATAVLELPRVLADTELASLNQGGSSGGGAAGTRRDLLVYFSFANHKLDPSSEPAEAVKLSSEPSLPEDKILQYLLGGAADMLTGSGDLQQFAQEELLAFGSSFISRYIEDELNLEAFRFGGSGDEDNPYYMDLEKELTPGFSVTYYRDFFTEANMTEEYGVKYRILEQRVGNRYNNVELELNFQQSEFRGSGSEFMFTWNTRF